jgi:hypothetical protein
MPEPTYIHSLPWPIETLPPTQRVLEAYPALAAYPVLVEYGSGENDQLLRFALFYAHKGSGLQALGDVEQKQREALRLAGIADDDTRVPQILAWRYRPVVLLTDAVVELQHSLKYGQWFYGTMMAWQTIKMLAVPIEGEAPAAELPADADPIAARVLAQLAGRTDDLAEDKKQRAYNTKNSNFTALSAQIETLEKLRAELFMSDEELAEASQREKLAGAGAVGARASVQTFVTGRPRIS